MSQEIFRGTEHSGAWILPRQWLTSIVYEHEAPSVISPFAHPGAGYPVRWHAGAEACAILGMIMAYIWLFRGRGPTVLVIVVAVLLSHWRRGETPGNMGFTRRGFAAIVPAVGLVAVILALLLAANAPGLSTGRGYSKFSVVLTFVGYWVWATIQQWALNGYFTTRFTYAFGGYRYGRWFAVVAAALCFGAAHLPNLQLAVPSTILGVLSAAAYQRYRNLFALGLAHGVLGTVVVVTMASSMPSGLRTGPDARARHSAVSWDHVAPKADVANVVFAREVSIGCRAIVQFDQHSIPTAARRFTRGST